MAIEKAGTVDPDKVRDAIAAIDTETFYGRVKFAEGGQINSLAAAGVPDLVAASRS